MTEEAKVRERLERSRTELEERLENINRELRQREEPLAADFAEQVVEQENIDVLYALEDEGKQELIQIDRALRRLEEGDYGLCTSCGNEIAAGRLEALPFTETCIECAD